MKTIAVLLAYCAIVTTAHAATINWGSAFGDFIYQSDGVTQAPASFNYELGAFDDGFTPNMANLNQWADRWHTLDQGTFNPTTGRLVGTVTLLAEPIPDGAILEGNATDTASFFFGKPANVWIYNQNTTLDDTLEWSLLSNPTGGGDPLSAWTFPSAAGSDPRAILEFAISDPGVTAAFGAEVSGGTPSTGGGDSSGTPAGSYAIQTFTLAAPIPEPSSIVLVMGGGLCLIACRRRKANF